MTGAKKNDHEDRLSKYIIDRAGEAIFILRPNGCIVYVNDSACKLLGYSKDEMVSMKAYDIDPTFNREKIVSIWKNIKKHGVINLESHQRRKDGKPIHTSLTINYLNFESQELAVAFIRDITEKKLEEQSQQVIYSLLNTINLSSDLSDLFERIRRELAVIMDSRNLFFALFDQDEKTADIWYFKGKKAICNQVETHLTLIGFVRENRKSVLLKYEDIQGLVHAGYITAHSAPALAWIGIPLVIGMNVIGVMGLTHYESSDNLTEIHLRILDFIASNVSLTINRRRSEESLRISEQHLRESNAAKDKFFSIIAHDLRSPFNAIMGFSELLFSEYTILEEEEKLTMISNIHEASVGAFKLLENLLEWSRIQTGRTVPVPEMVDLSNITNNCLNLLKPQAEKKSIKLFSGIQFGTMAFCDENMITTVIRNLLSNAVKFTRPGGNVSVYAIPGVQFVEVIVSDNGVGIPPEHLTSLFLLDESVKTKGTAGEPGTGLGLILCKEFTGLNGGSLWAESKPEQGSKFHVRLPAEKRSK